MWPYIQALERNGVAARPGISVGNMALPPGTKPQAPASTPAWKKIVIGVCVGVGAALLLLLAVCCCLFLRKKKKKKQQQQQAGASTVSKTSTEGPSRLSEDAATAQDGQGRKDKAEDGLAPDTSRWVTHIVGECKLHVRTFATTYIACSSLPLVNPMPCAAFCGISFPPYEARECVISSVVGLESG